MQRNKRLGVQETSIFPDFLHELPHHQVMLAQALKIAGALLQAHA